LLQVGRRDDVYYRDAKDPTLRWAVPEEARKLSKPCIGHRGTFLSLYCNDVPEDLNGFETDPTPLTISDGGLCGFDFYLSFFSKPTPQLNLPNWRRPVSRWPSSRTTTKSLKPSR
jgi:hypothetical protein